MTQNTPQRTQPEVLRLLRFHGISGQGIARSLGINALKVFRSLDPAAYGNNAAKDTRDMVRAHAEKMLRAAGWTGDTNELWAESDGGRKAA